MEEHSWHIWGLLLCTSEKAMAPCSSTFAWKIPWMEEPGRLQSMGLLELDTTERLHFHFSLSCIGEGHGNPLQCSCLENLRDGGAWWAAVYGVAQSRTRLKRLSSSSSSVKFNIWVLLVHQYFQTVAPGKVRYCYAGKAKIPDGKTRFSLRVYNSDKVEKTGVDCL